MRQQQNWPWLTIVRPQPCGQAKFWADHISCASLAMRPFNFCYNNWDSNLGNHYPTQHRAHAVQHPMTPVSRRFLLAGAAVTTASLIVPIGMRESHAGESEITDWIAIASNGEVTLALSQPEVGQGSYTALPQILADELDADWQRVKIRFATGKAAYKIAFRQEPPAQKEGASMSTTALYERLRAAGAAARDVLTRAAAQSWNIDVAQCRTENGFMINAREKASRMASLPPPPPSFPSVPRPRSRKAAGSGSSASRSRVWTRRQSAMAALSSASTSSSPACSTPPSRPRTHLPES